MADVLDDAQLAAALADLDGWHGDTKAITRTVKAENFAAGIRLVDAVAEVAESLDHHPDIDIRWTSITFTCATHSKGGVTELDIDLAKRINDLAQAMGAR
ncbi:MAG: 4a-hydroxytetrahydrobiopterin dehydratase [Acidothermus sp.]|nr:4a-hydroxytetrahydrobiopterin dehydratase [Acidothermus sp.]